MTAPHEVIIVTAKMDRVRDTKAHLFALHVAASLGCGHCLVCTDVGEERIARVLCTSFVIHTW